MSNLHVTHRGSGPPVLVLHGTPTTVAYLDPLCEALAAHGSRVLQVHLPGYGKSPPAPAGAGLDWTTDRIVETVGDIGSCAVVGHSGGSYRALALALDGRLRVDRLALLSPLAHLDEGEQVGFRQFAQALRDDVDLRGMLPARFLTPKGAEDPALAKAVTAWADAIARYPLADELEAFAAAPDLRPRLGELDAPTLLVGGAHDVATPPAKAEDLAARLPHARLEILDDAAHSLLHEARERTIALVLGHLSSPRAILETWFHRLYRSRDARVIHQIREDGARSDGLVEGVLDNAGFEAFHHRLCAAFPEVEVRIVDLVGEGPEVEVSMAIRATTRDGRSVAFPGRGRVRIDRGRIAQAENFFDAGSVSEQLGIEPPARHLDELVTGLLREA